MPVLQNLMEETVEQIVEEYMAKQNMCTCEQCRKDVAALALNNLPPRYIVTPKGASYSKADLLEVQKYVDVIGAINKAIKLVKDHPRH